MSEIEATTTRPGEWMSADPDRLGQAQSIDPASSLEQLIQRALRRSSSQIRRHETAVRSDSDPEDVHQLRVGIRRLNSDLRTFAPILRRKPLRELRSGLKLVGDAGSALRDCDVLTKRLSSEVRFLRRIDESGVALLETRLSEDHDAKRALMLEALASERHTSLVELLSAFAGSPPIRAKRAHQASEHASVTAPRFVRRPWTKLSGAVAHLGAVPSDTALHQVRILTKRCRYAAEAVTPVVPEARVFAKALADVQTLLGDHHDTVVAEEWLAAAAAEVPAIARIAYNLIYRQRTSRARLRAAWPATWDIAAAKDLRSWF
jgi:CHAD domain-containing protein